MPLDAFLLVSSSFNIRSFDQNDVLATKQLDNDRWVQQTRSARAADLTQEGHDANIAAVAMLTIIRYLANGIDYCWGPFL